MMRLITAELMTDLAAHAGKSTRGRQHLNLHASFDDPRQRFLNAILPHGYIRPHRHLLDPKPETLVALRGSCAIITFDDLGAIMQIAIISADCSLPSHSGVAAELSAELWHTVIALDDFAVILEVKPDPFDPAAAKEFAAWAPAEGSPSATVYMENLRAAVDRAAT